MSKALWGLAWASLAVCLIAPVQYFGGALSEESYKTVFLAASIGWFVFSTAGMRLSGR